MNGRPLTAETIARFTPHARPEIVAALVGGNDMILSAGIVPTLRLAHFMANIATETGGFQIYEENLNYSPRRLTQVWPSHFPTEAVAAPYAHNPEKLANFIYDDANRAPAYRLGNTEPGDGWRYRGRGLIQTTGRNGYRAVGHENDPDALDDPRVGLVAAIDEFVRSGCLPLADADNVEAVRRRINGGLNGIEDCRAYLARAKVIFTGQMASGEPWDAPTWGAYRSPVIAWAQDAMNRLMHGLPRITVDGISGPQTRNRTVAWQSEYGLAADGLIGPQTLQSLKAADAATQGGQK